MINRTLLGNGADPMKPGCWYEDAYYQILLIDPSSTNKPGKHIETTIVVGQRKKSATSTDTKNFSQYPLDQKTINRLGSYPEPPDIEKTKNTIAAHLPSPGVVFPEGFIKTLDIKNNHYTEISNFYEPIRTQLHTRKISQLIAKTWYTYLEAKKPLYANQNDSPTLWTSFIQGKWKNFGGLEQDNLDILDGLIAREIFLSVHNSYPDHLQPENLNIYYPLHSKIQGEDSRFLILPSSKAWQGIILSLLLSGQAYYGLNKDGKYTRDPEKIVSYHQISQPILSTGEIVMKYGLKVSWNVFEGDIREMSLTPGNSSIAYQAIIPYPPIPSTDNLSLNQIQAWADAEDDPKFSDTPQLPFYNKDKDGNYLVDVLYYSPPYPYIPLSCC
jgi:hypothetical protein